MEPTPLPVSCQRIKCENERLKSENDAVTATNKRLRTDVKELREQQKDLHALLQKYQKLISAHIDSIEDLDAETKDMLEKTS